MEQQENCPGCNQKDRCQEIFHRLGKAEGASVALKVVTALLVPIVIFITILAVFEQTLGKLINIEGLRVICGLVLALAVTYVYILVIKIINKALEAK